MKIKILNEALPSVKKKPVKLTKDPWVDNEDVEPWDFQVRRFYVYFYGVMVKNKNSHQEQYVHNAYEVARFILEKDAEGKLVPGKTKVTSDPTKFEKAKWYDFDIIAEAYDAVKEEFDAEKPDQDKKEIDLDDRRFYLRRNDKWIHPQDNPNKLWTANEIAALMWTLTDDQLLDNKFTARDKKEPRPDPGKQYKDVSEFSAIENASMILMRKAKEDPDFRPGTGSPPDPLRTVDGIKVRIGTNEEPCANWSPANSDKPFGNKQFDPFTPTAQRTGEWECNTELEQKAIETIQAFVTQNRKPEQEVINTLVDVARSASPEEPLHAEDDIDTLYRGTSREGLTGAPYDPQAKDILLNIDWDKVSASGPIMQNNKWINMPYKGSFTMAFPAASWTDNLSTAATFAKCGPNQNCKGARPFQFVYGVTPGASKSIGGTFINFDELYKLNGNNKAVDGDELDDSFFGFGDYKEFDQEVLLIGQQGSSMPVGMIMVNWDYLTDENTLKMLKTGLPEVHKKILSIMGGSPEMRGGAIFREFEKWAEKINERIQAEWDEWSAVDQLIYHIKSRESDPQKLKARLRRAFEEDEQVIKDIEKNSIAIYKDLTSLEGRRAFQNPRQPWNKDPSHPWHNISHKALLNSAPKRAGSDILETIFMLQHKIKTLGKQVTSAQKIIFGDGPI